MSQAISDTLAELIAMRAAGEITADEFMAARDRLRDADGSFSVEGRAVLAAARSAAAPGATPSGTTASSAVAGQATAVPKKPLRLRKTAAVIGVIVVALWALGSYRDRIVYKRSAYGASWPYPNYDTATVRCEVKKFGSTDRPVATVELDGVTYGLNGAARGIGAYPDPTPLEASDKPAIVSTRQAMINDALAKLCRWRQ